MTVEKYERRYTMYMAMAVWIHVTRDNLWLTFGGIALAVVATFLTLREEPRVLKQ